jgi:hypothetical protein
MGGATGRRRQWKGDRSKREGSIQDCSHQHLSPPFWKRGRPSWMRFGRECWDGDELLLYFFPYNDDDDDSVFFFFWLAVRELEREAANIVYWSSCGTVLCVRKHKREREGHPPLDSATMYTVVVIVDSQLFFHITLRSWCCREAPRFQFCLSLSPIYQIEWHWRSSSRRPPLRRRKKPRALFRFHSGRNVMGRPKGFRAKNERGEISDTISNVSSLLCLS